MDLVLTFVIIVSYCYKDITETAIKMFECLNFGDDSLQVLRLSQDLSVSCTDDLYKIWVYYVALPILILIGFCFPLLALIHMYRKKK